MKTSNDGLPTPHDDGLDHAKEAARIDGIVRESRVRSWGSDANGLKPPSKGPTPPPAALPPRGLGRNRQGR
jgi:hypothetical protein